MPSSSRRLPARKETPAVPFFIVIVIVGESRWQPRDFSYATVPKPGPSKGGLIRVADTTHSQGRRASRERLREREPHSRPLL